MVLHIKEDMPNSDSSGKVENKKCRIFWFLQMKHSNYMNYHEQKHKGKNVQRMMNTIYNESRYFLAVVLGFDIGNKHWVQFVGYLKLLHWKPVLKDVSTSHLCQTL